MLILIIEDNQPTRERLQTLLQSAFKDSMVYSVESAERAIEFINNSCPEIIILDIGLPGMQGDEVIPVFLEKCPATEIIVFTVSDEDEKVFACLKSGASGYILKDAKAFEIVEAVQELLKGGAPMSLPIARKLLKEFQLISTRREDEKSTFLSPREEEILNLLYEGATYKEISKALSISVHTVHTYIKRIYEKLHVKSRSQAVYKAIKKQIIRGY